MLRVLKLVGRIMAILGQVQGVIDSLGTLLDKLEADDYNGAASHVLSHKDVAPLVEKLSDEERAALTIAAPLCMKYLDQIVDEEAVKKLLDALDID